MILDLLENHTEGYLSGEYIGQELGVSRSAVWKHIKELKSTGYTIQSVSNKGYRMVKQNSVYSRYEILKRVENHINIIFLDEIDSTNEYAKRMAMEKSFEETAIIALSQIKGKGRLGRRWEASTGLGIWMSVLLKPRLSAADMGLVTLACACAVCETLKNKGFDAGIKWPNDILINDKKVCGILTETGFEETRICYVILGIGLNVLHSSDDFSNEIREKSTSLMIECGCRICMSEIAANTLDRILKYYTLLCEGQKDQIISSWKKYSVTLGRKIFTTVNGDKDLVTALDIRSDGALKVKREDGSIDYIVSGEILFKA